MKLIKELEELFDTNPVRIFIPTILLWMQEKSLSALPLVYFSLMTTFPSTTPKADFSSNL